MNRTVQPEILDSLPPDDPDARRSRADLRRINRLMGNHRWVLRTLTTQLRPGERVLEIGAGTGELCRELTAHGLAADGLDRCPQPAEWPSARTWHSADLLGFEGYGDYQAVVANLVLHHFTDAELAALGSKLRRGPRVICACEPARLRRSQAVFSLLGPVFGANRVTRHDARISIAAGFLGDELPRVLGLDDAEWSVRSGWYTTGSYRMMAVRP